MIAIYIDKGITIISRIYQFLLKIYYELLKDNRLININNSKESILYLRNRSKVFILEAEIKIYYSFYSHNI